MQTILVTDDRESWEFLSDLAPIVDAADYLVNDKFLQSDSLRVVNLCCSYQYQTIGYYVSLLAQARDHRTLPSVLNIQDVLNTGLLREISYDLTDDIQHSLDSTHQDEFFLNLYFGQSMEKKYLDLAKKLYGLFPLPLMRFYFEKRKNWRIKKLTLLEPKDIPDTHLSFMHHSARAYFSKKRFHQWSKKQRFHDLAILIDPTEANAPSDKKALELFVSAGESIGLNVDFIDKHDNRAIHEYDALFIRATTAVNHYTYRFARRAAQENLVVIDDPQSIVKCTNKVYLAELMRSHQIATPDTLFISKYNPVLPPITFPCVLKKPDSAFSLGVIKLDDMKSLQKALTQFFKTSDLVLLQQFIPTPFDWRIGIIDNKPLFACRYYMAKDHWQIYNWDSVLEVEGQFDTIPLTEVPDGVIKTALKATKLIGDGLYGVDIKSVYDKHYVIEVNDNPNVDANIEDQILGDELYLYIMNVFLQRIRRKHGYV
jgi:glutathione synthase/RimK-type ligase-like ATP-grasp enzyme